MQKILKMSLRDVDLNLLVTLEALLRERSVTRAGHVLGASQPAMSAALARLRDMFGDVRMLCEDTGLMNRPARLVWRICKINGRPSRYRSEPQREHLPVPAA